MRTLASHSQIISNRLNQQRLFASGIRKLCHQSCQRSLRLGSEESGSVASAFRAGSLAPNPPDLTSYHAILCIMPHLFHFSLSLHRFCSRVKLLSVDESSWLVHSRIPGPFTVHVKSHPRIHIFRVSSVEAAIVAQDNVNVVWHTQSRFELNSLNPKISLRHKH